MNFCPNCGHNLNGASCAGEEAQCPAENLCTWHMFYSRADGWKWKCAHGSVRTSHPNGYCDQGCCR